MRAKTQARPTEVIPENPDSFAAICKECGNGTLNNAATNSFKILQGYGHYEDQEFIVCRCCGSQHVEVVSL
jgi:hypothetical protein